MDRLICLPRLLLIVTRLAEGGSGRCGHGRGDKVAVTDHGGLVQVPSVALSLHAVFSAYLAGWFEDSLICDSGRLLADGAPSFYSLLICESLEKDLQRNLPNTWVVSLLKRAKGSFRTKL